MKKYQVIIASIIAALGISVIFAGAAVNNLNTEIADISNQVISGTTDKLSTEVKKKYNNYSIFLSEETKDRYELAVAKSRLNELSNKCDDCCTLLGTYDNKLHNSMDNYEYADAYKYIGYVLNNAINLHDIIIEYNDLLDMYPVLGEGLFEGGGWTFTVEDRCDIDYAFESLYKICFDTWFIKNCEIARSRMYEDNGEYSIYDPAFSDVKSGLILLGQIDQWCEHYTVGISEDSEYIYSKRGTMRGDQSDIIDGFNTKNTFDTAIESFTNTTVINDLLNRYYERVSNNLENDIDGSYFNTLAESDNRFLNLVCAWALEKDDGGYAIEYETFKSAFIDAAIGEIIPRDDYYAAAFGYMLYHRIGTGYSVTYFESVPITDSDISTYDSIINSERTSAMDTTCY